MKNTIALSLALLALSACQKSEVAAPIPTKISEDDAKVIANRNEVEFRSMDPARIKAVYAPDVVAFDAVSMPLVTDRGEFDKLQDAFAAEKFDSMVRKDRAIQILDPDTFIVSGTSELSGTAREGKDVSMRYTQVYEKQADGKWLIVNEHISLVK